MKWSEFLSDNSGGFSSMRLMFMVWALVVLFNWSWISFQTKSLQPIDSSVVTVLSALAAAKAVQRFGEKEATP